MELEEIKKVALFIGELIMISIVQQATKDAYKLVKKKFKKKRITNRLK